MITQRARNLLAGVTAAVVSMLFAVVDHMFDLSPVTKWSVLAVLTALLIYHLKNRSPYNSNTNDRFRLK